MSELEKLDKRNNINSDILIVEDNKYNRFVVICFLKKMQLSYDIAKNGLEGVNMIIKKNYRLVLMDIHMPVMNGKDAIKEIIKKNHPPIIVMTANAYQFDKEICRKLGAISFISKPLDYDKFQKNINKFIIPKEIIEQKNINVV